MTRFNVVLLVALLLSSLYLVRVSYDARRLFTELDRARNEARVLETDAQRLRAEMQAQATPLRVEQTARDKLAMRTATPGVTQYVTQSPQYVTESAAASAATAGSAR